MRKTKETHTFDFRPLGLAIREARERAGLSRNDLGDKVFYGERHTVPAVEMFHEIPKIMDFQATHLKATGDFIFQ